MLRWGRETLYNVQYTNCSLAKTADTNGTLNRRTLLNIIESRKKAREKEGEGWKWAGDLVYF